MNGIFSPAPCQSSIRVLVGTHLMLLVQAFLLIWSGFDLDGTRPLIWLALLVGTTGLCCAVWGESPNPPPSWRERRRGR